MRTLDAKEVKKRLEAAYNLMQDETTTREKFESIRTLIKGINPHVDKTLASSSKALTDLEKLHKGEVIELTAAHLPERSEKEKKRKKAILLFIASWKDLKGEMQRVRVEFDKMQQTPDNTAGNVATILSKVKGPLGLITIAAVVIVGAALVFNKPPTTQTSLISPTSSTSPTVPVKIKVINFNGKQLPVEQLRVGDGPDCGQGGIPHYHALNSVSVKALDGVMVPDPGACGYGRVAETRIEEVVHN